MRRIFLAGVALAAVAAVSMPAQAARAINATIVLPTGATGLQGAAGCPSAPGCYKTQVSRHVRCIYLADPSLNQDGTTGRFGFVIGINTSDSGRPFTLTDQTGLPAGIDFDVAWYQSLGSCEGESALGGENPTPMDPPSFGRLGNESGVVPAGSRFAIVTMFGGANGLFRLSIS